MSDWIYTARERFRPAHNDGWSQYVQWSGFTHITELVTLDHILCPELIDDLIDDDWSHNVHADNRITWFTDSDYLRKRSDRRYGRDQLIAMIENPDTVNKPHDGFVAVGFDILDEYDSISVLTNCGRFPGIFDPSAVNSWGLIEDIAEAKDIAERIRSDFPDEPHCCDCRVWQISRDAEFRK